MLDGRGYRPSRPTNALRNRTVNMPLAPPPAHIRSLGASFTNAHVTRLSWAPCTLPRSLIDCRHGQFYGHYVISSVLYCPAMTEWYEQDSFWERFAPCIFSRDQWDNGPPEAERLQHILQLPGGARVLDLCCGPGRHSVPLAKQGYRVTGVDRTASFLEQAREYAAEEGVEPELVKADMREFVRSASFDAAINMYTSFGYFRDQADDRKVATHLYESLVPGGVLLIDMSSKEIIARVFRERDWHEKDGVIYLEERKLDPGWGWMSNHWTVIAGRERFEATLSHRLYSGTELAALLRDAGFKEVALYGDLFGSPYDQNAKRLVAVARR
jgi:SAM-dependent methyltransferase